ncbi:MAG: glucose-6-phosphate isomerase, partial [Anaerovorax sp.]
MIDYSDVKIKNTNRNRLDRALAEMDALEGGAIANPDEHRMVGHYWLRNPSLAPTGEIRAAIEQCIADITQFALTAQKEQFKKVLIIGIGGSALGPRFISTALKRKDDAMDLYFLDN